MRARTDLVRAVFLALPVALAASLPPPAAPQSAGELRSQARTLREQHALVAARSNAAVLGLFAFDANLDAAQARLAWLQARKRALERTVSVRRARIRTVERALARSRRRLRRHLQATYERGGREPLAVLLAAASPRDLRRGLERLADRARTRRTLLARVRARRAELGALRQSLAALTAEHVRLGALISRTSRSYAAAQARREQYVARLLAERRARTAKITSLATRARLLEARAHAVSAGPAAPRISFGSQLSATQAAYELVAFPGFKPGAARVLTVTATAYALPGTTASGIPVGRGVVAVDPAVIPLGSRLVIPGYGSGIAADTGLAVRGTTIDLWFPTVAQALAWGRRTVTIAVR